MKQNGNGIHDFRILISYVKYYVAKNKKVDFYMYHKLNYTKWKAQTYIFCEIKNVDDLHSRLMTISPIKIVIEHETNFCYF